MLKGLKRNFIIATIWVASCDVSFAAANKKCSAEFGCGSLSLSPAVISCSLDNGLVSCPTVTISNSFPFSVSLGDFTVNSPGVTLIGNSCSGVIASGGSCNITLQADPNLATAGTFTYTFQVKPNKPLKHNISLATQSGEIELLKCEGFLTASSVFFDADNLNNPIGIAAHNNKVYVSNNLSNMAQVATLNINKDNTLSFNNNYSITGDDLALGVSYFNNKLYTAGAYVLGVPQTFVRGFNLDSAGLITSQFDVEGAGTFVPFTAIWASDEQPALNPSNLFAINYSNPINLDVFSIAPSGALTLQAPIGLPSIIAPRGVTSYKQYVYITNGDVPSTIFIFDSALATVTSFSDPNLSFAYGAAVAGTQLYVTSSTFNEIVVFDINPSNGSLSYLRTLNNSALGLNSPRGITFNNSYAYVSNWGGKSVSVLKCSS